MEHWDEGVYMLRARHNRQASPLILSCGVHGDETLPVDVVRQLLADISARLVPLQRPCLLVFANPPALLNNRRFMRHNLNRLFGASRQVDGYEGERALVLQGHCREFSDLYGQGWHLDLHATIKPSRHADFALKPACDRAFESQWLPLLAQAGFSALVCHLSPSNTFAHFTCNQLGYDSFTLECGSIAMPDSSLAVRLRGLLETLLTRPGLPDGDAQDLALYDVVQDLVRRSTDFHFLIDEEGENFRQFDLHTAIASDQGVTISAPVQDCALLFANSKVPIGDRAGLLLARR